MVVRCFVVYIRLYCLESLPIGWRQNLGGSLRHSDALLIFNDIYFLLSRVLEGEREWRRCYCTMLSLPHWKITKIIGLSYQKTLSYTRLKTLANFFLFKRHKCKIATDGYSRLLRCILTELSVTNAWTIYMYIIIESFHLTRRLLI